MTTASTHDNADEATTIRRAMEELGGMPESLRIKVFAIVAEQRGAVRAESQAEIENLKKELAEARSVDADLQAGSRGLSIEDVNQQVFVVAPGFRSERSSRASRLHQRSQDV